MLTRTLTISIVTSLSLSLALAQKPNRAFAQNTANSASRLANPMLGYVPAPSSLGLRPIVGVAGASVFGDPLALPSGVTRLHMAPLQQYALAERQDAANLAILSLPAAALAEIPGAASHPALIAFSPSGSAAVLFSPASGQLQSLSGLPDASNLSNLPAIPAADTLLSLAISDDGNAVVYAASSGELYLSVRNGPWTPIFRGVAISGLSFVPAQANLIVCDRGAGKLQLITGLLAAPAQSILASGLDLPPAPAFVKVSSDSRLAVITGTGADRLLVVDLASGQARSIAAPAPVEGLDQLKASGVMLISARPTEPGWLLLTDSPDAQLRFVPAPQLSLSRTAGASNGTLR
jgi:hypothetical protein